MSAEVMIAIVSGIVSVIGAAVTWFINAKKQKAEIDSTFRDDLLERIKQQNEYVLELNERIDVLQKERQELSDKYDTKTAEIRAEMRKVIEASAVEVAHWKENYNKLLDDYQKLKIEHYVLRRDYNDIRDELEHLRKAYETVSAKYEVLKKEGNIHAKFHDDHPSTSTVSDP